MFEYTWFQEYSKQLNRDETKKHGKQILEAFKEMWFAAKYTEMPKMTSSMRVVNIPSTSSERNDPIAKAIVAKDFAEREVVKIFSAIDNLRVGHENISDLYYRRLLWLKYIKKNYGRTPSNSEVSSQLAKEFPTRDNPNMVEKWNFQRDQEEAIIAFVLSFDELSEDDEQKWAVYGERPNTYYETVR